MRLLKTPVTVNEIRKTPDLITSVGEKARSKT